MPKDKIDVHAHYIPSTMVTVRQVAVAKRTSALFAVDECRPMRRVASPRQRARPGSAHLPVDKALPTKK
jgi:hypothetical protein